MPQYTPMVTLAAVALYFFFATRVAAARGRYGVPLPATTGHPDFERIYRVQANTLEWLPIFLAPLWLCALYWSDSAASLLGLLWLVGRLWYFAGYRKAVEKRLAGFFVQTLACVLLFAGAAYGVAMHLTGG